jgi:hypothetical protein
MSKILGVTLRLLSVNIGILFGVDGRESGVLRCS